jgi:pimeloyl-ACP methyl ester carboxylesterase
MLLKREGRPRLGIKVVGNILLLITILAMLGGCAWIHDWLNPNQTPVAVISANPTSGEAPLEVTFDASESYDPDGDEISYEWNFGDGIVEVGETVQHEFATPGNYITRLAVTDGRRGIGTSNITVAVFMETVQSTIGQSGGTVKTDQGSCVTFPPDTFPEDTTVAISKLAEPIIRLRSDVEDLGSVQVTLASGSSGTQHALLIKSASSSVQDYISVQIPLSTAVQKNAKIICLLQILSGENPVLLVLPVSRDNSTVKTIIPLTLLRELCSVGSIFVARPLASPKIMPGPGDFIHFDVTFCGRYEAHVEPKLYRVESSTSQLAEVTNCQDEEIVPIILVHGYRIMGADDLRLSPYTPATVFPPPEYYDKHEDYAKESWATFVTYFYSRLKELNKEVPGSYKFVLYEYRWDTDDGVELAAEALADEFSSGGVFGNRALVLIGHSAGGVVARACAELYPESVGDQLVGMITLASPHLGARYIEALFDTTSDELKRNSKLIKTLNQKPGYNDKLVAYGGWFASLTGVLPGIGHNDWCTVSQLLYNFTDANDGVVELESAVLLGDRPQITRKTVILDDYDHLEMRDDKANGKHVLYEGICADLQRFAEELAEDVNKLPIVSIISPTDGATYTEGETITFEGEAIDPEDGALTGDSLFWSLPSGEIIGTGESFTKNDLPVGAYVITLNAADSQLGRGENSVTITVTGAEKPDLSVAAVSLSKPSAKVGDTISVTFTVENKGGSTPGQFKYGVFLATTKWGTTVLADEFSWPGVLSLSPGLSLEIKEGIVIPQVPDGNYYVTVYVDNKEQVAESDENNNIGSTYPDKISIGSGPVKTLDSVTISGPSQVDENSTGDYTCTAYFSDGSNTNVTSQATWSENTSYTTISSGRLTVGSLSSNKTCTVTASYTYKGVAKSASKSVTLKNVPVPKALDRVTISGANEVNENSSADYTCTAYFSDGSNTNVTNQAIWSENTSYATISSGRLTVGSLSSNKTCTVTTSYTYKGVTESANKSVTLKKLLTIGGQITGYQVSPNPASVGDSASFRVTVKNTGNTSHTFVAGLSVWKVGSPISAAIIDTNQQVTLSPNQQKTLTLRTYSFSSSQTGDWYYQFGLWKDQAGGTLLHKAPSPAEVISVAKFLIGNRVQVTQNLNVRTGPGVGYLEITDPDYPGYAPSGTLGTVLEGPVSADGYVWWKVQHDQGFTGWSVENGLRKI